MAERVYTVAQENEYTAATAKVKVTTEITINPTQATFVMLRALMGAKGSLKVAVGPKGALVALVAPGAEGAAKEAVVLSFIVPAGQYYEITTTGVEGEPTVSYLAL